MNIHLSRIGRCFLPALLFASGAQGQQFWNRTAHGMTKAAVRGLFKEKLEIESESVLTLAYQFCKTEFEVAFVFQGDGLDQVILHGKGGAGSDAVTKCVVKEYISSFGKPELTEPQGNGDFTYIFRRNATVVEITTITVTDLVFVNYRLRRSEL